MQCEGLTSPFAVYIMEKPVFVVLRKYFHVVNGACVPFVLDGGDVELFGTYDAAKESALKWCENLAHDVFTYCDIGELPAAPCQYDNLVLQCIGSECSVPCIVRVVAEVYQKYVL